ncbi:uncharacterized protein LOC105695828 [Orussus abietinus]|uniref:uncharacterized protein LOC105695828 n=1 Tax=Orussus abietinus TaxID=222816 RepID=UPI000625377D|nr:uncharacterized protein LOC105695828 [Orussus abietinus]
MDKLSETNVWAHEPTPVGIIIYSVIIPTISGLGILGNALILAVLGGATLKASTYTYLAVLAGADLVTCALLLFSGLARGIFWGERGWLEFDAFVHLPLGSVSSNIAVWAAVCVTLDRLILISGPPKCKPPRFCDDKVAKKLMISCCFFSLMVNIPYCFIYTYNDDGHLTTTRFFESWLYDVQNWFQLAMFGLVPAVFLLVGNGIMCHAVRKAMRQRELFMKRRKIREGNCLRDQTRLTITLVGIVFIFLVGEFPTHLASRRSAASILYGGDVNKIDEHFMERFRMCCTVLNAISSSANFILYCLLSPHFLRNLKNLAGWKTQTEKKQLRLKMQMVERLTKDSLICTKSLI